MDERVRVALRADHEIERLPLGQPQIVGNRGWVEVEVGVDERDPPPERGERAELDRVALAEVPVVVDDACELALLESALVARSSDPSETTMISNGSRSFAAIRSRIVRTFSTIRGWL